MQLTKAFERWLNLKMFQGQTNGRHKYVGQRTLRDYSEYIRALARFFSGKNLDEITPQLLREYQSARAPNVGPNKIEQELALLRWVMTAEDAWTSQLAGYDKLLHEECDIPQALTPEEQEHFLRVAASSEEHLLMHCYSVIVLDSTASEYEMRALRICDVTRSPGLLYVRWGKNRHRVRQIALTKSGREAVEKLVERAKTLGAVDQEHYLFPFRVKRNFYDPNRHVNPCGFAKPWDKLRTAAEVPSFQLNALRHTALTRYAEAGTAIAVMKAMAGHISERMTLHYIQVSESAMRKAQEAIAVKKPPLPVRDSAPRPWECAL